MPGASPCITVETITRAEEAPMAPASIRSA
jgi:hypothetical protein